MLLMKFRKNIWSILLEVEKNLEGAAIIFFTRSEETEHNQLFDETSVIFVFTSFCSN